MAASDVESDVGVAELGTQFGSPPPGAADDEDTGATMTLVEHLEELRRRLMYVAVAVALASILGFIFWSPILGFLLTPLPAIANQLPHAGGQRLVATDIGEPFLISLKLSIAVGITVASPFILYQVWGFISPGLTRRERKYALPFTVLGVVLFAAGLVVGFITLRYPVTWLVQYGQDKFTLLLDANSYFTFVAYFLLAFGIVFELPLVLTFMSLIGIVNSRMLRQKRRYILFGLWVLSCFITPGADPYSPVIVGAALTILFELSILLMRLMRR
jgi:sec-independent protein translocase protein TatC